MCLPAVSLNSIHFFMKFSRLLALPLLVASTLALPALFGARAAPGAQPTGPNIIFIFADDLGWGDLGSYGHPHIKTPNLDRMARDGALFTQFYVANPVCSPSRAGVMTGQYPARLGVHTALSVDPAMNRDHGMVDYLNPEGTLVTRLFQEHGYKVGHFGKWHLGRTRDSPLPSAYGIDEYLTHGSRDGRLKGPRHQSTEIMVDATIDFITRHREERFFINLWTLVPHAILAPTESQMAPYEHLGPGGEAKGLHRGATEIYYGTITDLDHQVGRLLEHLATMGLMDNTIVVFSSDNGPEDIHLPNASHSGIGSPGPFRGRKRSLYEGGIRVPFIVHGGPAAPVGHVDDKTVIGAVDLLPTFCALAGIPLPADFAGDGEDMSAALRGEVTARQRPLLWEWRYDQAGHTLNKSPRLALRDGHWKFLMNPDGSRLELYNFADDPQSMELNNVADRHPERVARYAETLREFEQSLPPGPVAPNSGRNAYRMPRP